MKPRLIILSDLWGVEKSEWTGAYIQRLKTKYDIQYYDCCKIGGVDKTEYTENSLHIQFTNGGIERAANRLFELENDEVDVLAYSVGGVIAWKAERLGLKINRLFSISSTRLRYEREKPNCYPHLYFGEKDDYKPNFDWFNEMECEPKIIKDKSHTFYTELDSIIMICKAILI
jgi:hypothetical protein